MRQRLPILLLRIALGLYFLCEGVLVFLLPDAVGSGRMSAIGLPSPEVLAVVAGSMALLGGLFLLLNFYAGESALLLLLQTLASLVATRLPVLTGQPIGPFKPVGNSHGWASFLHAGQTDLLLVVALIAVIIDAGLILGRRRRWYQDK